MISLWNGNDDTTRLTQVTYAPLSGVEKIQKARPGLFQEQYLKKSQEHHRQAFR